MTSPRHREEVVNTVLAYVLGSYGFSANPETIQRLASHGRRLPDVIFAYRGLRCVVEGKYADVPSAATELVDTLEKRMDSGLAQVGIGIIYPEEFRTTSLADLEGALSDASNLQFLILTEQGAGFWQTGGVSQLLERLRHAQELLARDDLVQEVAEDLSATLDLAAESLIASPAVCDRITHTLGIGSAERETKASQQKRRQTGARIATLTVANALIFHELLSSADERVTPLRKLLSEADTVTATSNHWQRICDNINYVPIFSVSREVLLQLPASQETQDLFLKLANQALSICTNRSALRHDLMGRIYHYLLHDAKFLGTYYTSVAAANLLLKLALHPPDWPSVDFGNPSSLNDFKVGDMACGTGTLLMASSQAVIDNFVRRRVETGQSLNEKAFRNLHQTLMENTLYGYDVLQSAIHLSASTLALLSPEVSFRSMHLYSMPLGKLKSGEVRLGSIDFATGDRLPVQFDIEGGYPGASEQITGRGTVSAVASFPSIDLCVMNPPFTRSVNSNLLFGSIPDNRDQLQKALKKLVSEYELSASITAGLGSVFVGIADKYVRPGGRLALVVPAAIATGDAWRKTRELFGKKYFVETVVVSHDPEKWSFSENTDLSEVLLIAQRKAPGASVPGPIRYINLWRNVTTSSEALAVSHEIIENVQPARVDDRHVTGTSPIVIGSERVGEIIGLERTGSEVDWYGGCFAQTDLVRIAWGLRKGYLTLPGYNERHSFPITSLGKIATFGPDGRDIHDAFKLAEGVTPYPALWGTDADFDTTLSKAPNRWLDPRSEKKKGRPYRDPTKLWPRSARLMISSRVWLQTQRVVAVYLGERALSNIWAPTRIDTGDSRDDKILAIWLNSTLGLTLMFSARVPTRGPWIQFKKPNLKTLPIIDPRKLTNSQKEDICYAYDQVRDSVIRPFPELVACEVRQEIDDRVARAFSLPDLSPVRELLGREPIVSSKRIHVPEYEEKEPQLQLFELV